MPKIVQHVTPANVQEVMILHAALGSIGKVSITEEMYQEYRRNHDEYRIIYDYEETGNYTVEVVREDPDKPLPEEENAAATLKLKILAAQASAARRAQN